MSNQIPENADALYFSVGAKTYSVIVPDGPIVFYGGDSVAGYCSEPARRILLSRDDDGAERLDTLFHELMHAWHFGTCMPKDPEEMSRLFATVATSVFMELEAQGGTSRLNSLKPTRDFDTDRRFVIDLLERAQKAEAEIKKLQDQLAEQKPAKGPRMRLAGSEPIAAKGAQS